MRLVAEVPRTLALAAISGLLLAVSACDRSASTSGDAAGVPTSSTAILPKAVPPSTSPDPQEVLLSWAKAISLKDWATAYGYWGDGGKASGMTLDQFTAAWSKLGQPDLEIGKGVQEGAAGSLYYSVPVTVIDGGRRIAGTVVLRRVNDVEGATPEQLRWHIESSTITP
ncbi:hypothetical protein [Novosphingobium sp.]|uniref:hypothetical protein n=1 Tax=Novosphingobium sp. TaxID=1874826 RepID=UPI0025F1283B|nr:hypothetical protein [Novosphingobium sp.]